MEEWKNCRRDSVSDVYKRQILQYGAGTQSKMADFSETALENVKTKDLGEVGELLGNVVKELKNFDEEEEKGFFGIFKKQANKIQACLLYTSQNRQWLLEGNIGSLIFH